MFDKRLVKNIDFGLLVDVVLISLLGIIAISSATHITHGGSIKTVVYQSIWLVLGIMTALLIMKIDYNVIGNYYKLIYAFSIFCLILTLFLAKNINGAESWITIGGISLQFSEFAKIALIISIAKYLDLKRDSLNSITEIGKIILIVGIPFVLILKQNDFGTAMVLLCVLLGMLYMSGINLLYIFSMISIGAVATPLLYKYALKGYQKDRIMTFLNPNLDKAGAGYHVNQSKIAIGSGRIFGYGLYKGTQIQYDYLPEASTDFIFSVVGQELGFVGAAGLLLLYFIMLYKLIQIAIKSKDYFGSMMVMGIVCMFLVHIFENIGMTIGLMPVTGIPLPFMSKGGSSLLANMIAIGLALNVGMRKQKINF